MPILLETSAQEALDGRRRVTRQPLPCGLAPEDAGQGVGDSWPSPLDEARAEPEPAAGSNGRRPASISNRTTPKAQMSARLSAGLPRACSGLM